MTDNQQSTVSAVDTAFRGASHLGHPSAEWDGNVEFEPGEEDERAWKEATSPDDVSYFRLRASKERTAALQSREVNVRRVHSQLAERYEERVRQIMASRSQMWL